MKTEYEYIADMIARIREKAGEYYERDEWSYENGKIAFAKELLDILEESQNELARKIKRVFE